VPPSRHRLVVAATAAIAAPHLQARTATLGLKQETSLRLKFSFDLKRKLKKLFQKRELKKLFLTLTFNT
jgi:hypothetical protein